MRKIPTLFRRDEVDRRRLTDVPAVQLSRAAVPTIKYDGIAVRWDADGRWWKRHEAMPKALRPADFIEEERDETTGKYVGWTQVDGGDVEIREAILNAENEGSIIMLPGMTFEAVGPGIVDNPHRFTYCDLLPHGEPHPWAPLGPMTYDEVRRILSICPDLEGIVWYELGLPVAKIKRVNLGLAWPAPLVMHEAGLNV